MKKLAIFIVISAISLLLVACGEKTTPSGDKTNTDKVDNTQVEVDSYGAVEYKEPKFMENAGFEIVKDPSLSDIKYSGVNLIGNQKGQVDLTYDDGKKATLSVTGNEYFFDEEEATTTSIANCEVSKISGLDGIDHYYWTKDDTYYILAVESTTNFPTEEIERLINGFSINVGDNY